MKTGTTTHYALCRFKNRPDTACKNRPRCRACGRPIAKAFFKTAGVCGKCLPVTKPAEEGKKCL